MRILEIKKTVHIYLVSVAILFVSISFVSISFGLRGRLNGLVAGVDGGHSERQILVLHELVAGLLDHRLEIALIRKPPDAFD